MMQGKKIVTVQTVTVKPGGALLLYRRQSLPYKKSASKQRGSTEDVALPIARAELLPESVRF